MDIVCNYYFIVEACAEPCDSQWVYFAKEVLALTHIHVSAFAYAVRTLFEMGRGKHRNILIFGVANSIKSFMLNPNTAGLSEGSVKLTPPPSPLHHPFIFPEEQTQY